MTQGQYICPMPAALSRDGFISSPAYTDTKTQA